MMLKKEMRKAEMKTLDQCRAELDAIDAQLVSLFEKRMQIARDVAQYKHAHNLNILDASRESAVLESRAAMLQDETLKKPLQDLFCEIMRLSREEQKRYLDALGGAPGDCKAAEEEYGEGTDS